MDTNLLAMLQRGMGGGSSMLTGPIPAQNPTPGFRAPPTPGPMGFAPRPQEQSMGVPSLGLKAPASGRGGSSPFAGQDVSNMNTDQQIAAFSSYAKPNGTSPFAGVDVSGMSPDQQIAAFSTYGSPQGGAGGSFTGWLSKLFGGGDAGSASGLLKGLF